MRRSSAAVIPVVIVLLLITSVGLNFRDHRSRVLSAYPKINPLVSQAEQALFSRIANQTEPGAIVAQMPFNGSPAAMAVSQRQVLFPQLGLGRITNDQAYLAQHLNQAATDPRVCEIAHRLQVQYLLSNDTIWKSEWDDGSLWVGMTHPTSSGFQQIDQGGAFRLYRLSACDQSPAKAIPESKTSSKEAQAPNR